METKACLKHPLSWLCDRTVDDEQHMVRLTMDVFGSSLVTTQFFRLTNRSSRQICVSDASSQRAR
jgi:hypothetical protein